MQSLLDVADVFVVLGVVVAGQLGPGVQQLSELVGVPEECAGHAGSGQGGSAGCGFLGEFLDRGDQGLRVTVRSSLYAGVVEVVKSVRGTE
ncbi:hypothetical protein ABIE67_000233 [Streptomyces sp. V4I8]|uniref:hypothetical protein n=1 Tax=Streptomyces sp. V4I8 TaxID=3156469 RepID=UPI00351316A2